MSIFKRLAAQAVDPFRTARYVRATRDPNMTPPILCPSIGRVGSTLLWHALVENRGRSLLGSVKPTDWRRISREAWDLRDTAFQSGCVYKTHGLPVELDYNGPLKVVFLFGRPSDVALSVWRKARSNPAWGNAHFSHMRAKGAFNDILDNDVLRLGEHIDAWFAFRGNDTLCLKYEELWQTLPVLKEFVGFTVRLPKRRDRGFTDVDRETIERFRATYAGLDAKHAALPAYHIHIPPSITLPTLSAPATGGR